MPQKDVFHKQINKKVNKQNIGNSENWLFDDVSKILNWEYWNSGFWKLVVRWAERDAIPKALDNYSPWIFRLSYGPENHEGISVSACSFGL